MPLDDDVASTRRALIDALRRARGTLGLTQEDVADALGVSRASMVRLESGAASPLLDNLIRALHLLGQELVVVSGNDPAALAPKVEAAPVPRRVNRP